MVGVGGADVIVLVEEFLNLLDCRLGEAGRIGAVFVTEEPTCLFQLLMTSGSAGDDKRNGRASDRGSGCAYSQHV